MKNILKNIGWYLIGIFMGIMILTGILIFCSMIIFSLIECYKLNSNTLFIIIPMYIFFGWYFTSYLKHNK